MEPVKHVRLMYTMKQAEDMLGLPLGLLRRVGEFPPPDNHHGMVPLWSQVTIENWWMTRKGDSSVDE